MTTYEAIIIVLTSSLVIVKGLALTVQIVKEKSNRPDQSKDG